MHATTKNVDQKMKNESYMVFKLVRITEHKYFEKFVRRTASLLFPEGFFPHANLTSRINSSVLKFYVNQCQWDLLFFGTFFVAFCLSIYRNFTLFKKLMRRHNHENKETVWSKDIGNRWKNSGIVEKVLRFVHKMKLFINSRNCSTFFEFLF